MEKYAVNIHAWSGNGTLQWVVTEYLASEPALITMEDKDLVIAPCSLVSCPVDRRLSGAG